MLFSNNLIKRWHFTATLFNKIATMLLVAKSHIMLRFIVAPATN